MNRLLILGAGGHGKVVAETAEAGGIWEKIAFLDDRHSELDGSLRWPVLAGFDKAGDFTAEFSHAVVAMGSGEQRLHWLAALSDLGFDIPVLIHPAAWVSPSAKVGRGSVVMAGATIQADTRIESGCIINTGASVDHDCVLGDGVHICPGATLAGDVTVERCGWLGVGSSVIQGIRIGENVTVGAGAAVIEDIASQQTVVGVPAKPVSGKGNR